MAKTSRFDERSLKSVGWLALATAVACGSLNPGEVIITDDGGGGSGAGGSTSDAGEASNGGSSPNGAAGEGGEVMGGAGAPPEGTAPRVVSITPEDEATGVSPELATIELEFSEPLEPGTVTEDSVRLLDGAEALTGELEVSGATVTFTPDAPLALLARYTVEVTTDVTDTQGEALEADFSASFATADGAWGDITDLDADADDTLGSVTLATNRNGDVLAGFARPSADFQTTQAVTRWYRRGSGWEAPTAHNVLGTHSNRIAVSINDLGEAAITYGERDAAGEKYYFKRYTAGAWQPRVLLANIGPNANVAVGRVSLTNGGVAVLSANVSGTSVRLGYALPSKEISFEPVGTYANINGGALATDAEGRAVFVYRTYINAQPSVVRFARFNPDDNAWSDAAATLPSSLGDSAPAVAVSETGEAMALWRRTPENDVVASRFQPASGWSEPATLDTLAGEPIVTPSSVVSDGRGFRAIWVQEATASLTNLYSSTFDPDGGTWSAPELVSDGNSSVSPSLPSLGLDRRGNALVTWAQGQNTAYRGWFNRYDAVAGQWVGAASMPDAASIFSDTACVVSEEGLGFAVWTKGVTSDFEFWAAPFE